MKIHLDFETRCDLDLRKVGVRNYVSHESFAVLMTAMALDDDPVLWWEGLPDFSRLLNGDHEWHAFNAPFEIAVLKSQGIHVPLERWRCTMAHAYARGFVGNMAQVGAQVGLPQDKRKLTDGSRLINKFCKPRAESKDNPDKYWYPETAPEDWERFMEYNIQDVVTEREIARFLSQYPLTQEEIDLWVWDQQVNARGLPVDDKFINAALALSQRYHMTHLRRLKEITGLPNSFSRNQLLAWLKERGYPENDLQAATIERVLKEHMTGMNRVSRPRYDS